jgi:hypothetical protein
MVERAASMTSAVVMVLSSLIAMTRSTLGEEPVDGAEVVRLIRYGGDGLGVGEVSGCRVWAIRYAELFRGVRPLKSFR